LKQQELKSQADVHAAAAAAAAAAGMAAHADRQKVEEERMRLYEKLSEAERSKSEAIQRVFEQALKGQQDAVAQMIGGLAKAHTPPRPAAPAPVAAPPQAPGTAPEWHVIGDGNTQTGPHTLRQVQMMVQQGRLVTESLVWRAGMDGWVAIAECEEFADVVASVPPPSPPAPPSRP
jgi:hypothetical protein